MAMVAPGPLSRLWLLRRARMVANRVHFSVRASASSKMPDLMRYIPKSERKSGEQKLEVVRYPKLEVGVEEMESLAGMQVKKRTWKHVDDKFDWTRAGVSTADGEVPDGHINERNAEFVKVRKEAGEAAEQQIAGEFHWKTTGMQAMREAEAADRLGDYNSQQEEPSNCSRDHIIQQEEPPPEAAEEIFFGDHTSQQEELDSSYHETLKSRFPKLKLVPASGIKSRPGNPQKKQFVSLSSKQQFQGLGLFRASETKQEDEVLGASRGTDAEDDGEVFSTDYDEDEDLLRHDEDGALSDKIKQLSTQDNSGERSAAKNYAIFLLGQGQKTAAELRKKLRDKNYSSRVVEHTISELRDCGFQSDVSYAEVFAQSRWNSRGWSAKRIKYELMQKGVDVGTVDRALKQVFETDEAGNSLEDTKELKWGMSKAARDHLLLLAAKKWKTGGNISDEVRKRRLAGWLQRRGFSWNVITGVINVLEDSSSRSSS